jgi:hypothetical protein
MPVALATRIIVFGRGLVAEGTGFRLTRQSSERVEALVANVRQNAAAFAAGRERIVFSGGWAGAAEGFGRPPRQYREGSLMLAQAIAADIGGTSLVGYADAYAEIESCARWRTSSTRCWSRSAAAAVRRQHRPRHPRRTMPCWPAVVALLSCQVGGLRRSRVARW